MTARNADPTLVPVGQAWGHFLLIKDTSVSSQ